MKYYIACDGGGSKLAGILYDEDLNVIRTSTVKGVNTLFMDRDEAWSNIEKMMSELTLDGKYKIERIDACLVGNDSDMMKRFLALDAGRINIVSEARMALASALRRTGTVALSGTGSDAFAVYSDGTRSTVGGYGALLGDEGSGYDIGLRSIKAAMYSDDGRGEKSLLEPMVLQHFGASSFWDIVLRFVKNPNARREIAAVSALTAKAAAEGDKAAIGIYEYAGRELARQTCTVIARDESRFDGFVMIVGGAWKGSEVMFDTFRTEVLRRYPDANVSKPLFEPIVGCAVVRLFEEGFEAPDFYDRLMRGFADYVYKY